MKIKQFICAGVAATMVIGCIPYTVSADHMDFGSRAQIKVDDCPTGGWGTIQLEENKILKADDNTDLAKISSSQSVFNQFVYNRGRNYYDYASSNSKFAYDTKQSDYVQKLPTVNICMPFTMRATAKVFTRLILRHISAVT